MNDTYTKEELDEINQDTGYVKKDMCFTSNINVIKKLAEEGYEIKGWDICGHTPVHYHAINGNFEIVKFLLKKGADPYEMNLYGDFNAYTGALDHKQLEIAAYIKKIYGKKCNIKSKSF